MNRRRFLTLFAAAAGAAVIAPAISAARVWSFPSKIVIPQLSLVEMDVRYLQPAAHSLLDLRFPQQFKLESDPLLRRPARRATGEPVKVAALALPPGLRHP